VKFQKKPLKILPYLYLLPPLVVMSIVFFYPMGEAFYISLHTRLLLKKVFEFAGLKNYIQIFKDPDFWNSLRVTFIWTIGSVVLQFLLGLGTALLLNMKFKGRTIARAFMLIPWVLPSVVAGTIWKWLYHTELGIINNLLSIVGLPRFNWLGDWDLILYSLIIANAWKGFPFYTVGILAALQTIPPELYESADIDGAGLFAKFKGITLPSIFPVISLLIVITTLWTFKEFDLPYILLGSTESTVKSAELLSLLVYRHGFTNFNYGYSAALSYIVLAVNGVFAYLYTKMLFGKQGGLIK